MATSRTIGGQFPRTDPKAIAKRTFRRVNVADHIFTVRIENDGGRITGAVTSVELAHPHSGELPSISDFDMATVVQRALNAL